jgi:hypothetical protein
VTKVVGGVFFVRFSLRRFSGSISDTYYYRDWRPRKSETAGNIDGNSMNMVSCIACIWVLATVDIQQTQLPGSLDKRHGHQHQNSGCC